ncbi:MAG: DNA double-strand break repair nuclease NurA [Candidatus Bathyarchaeia archaeon]
MVHRAQAIVGNGEISNLLLRGPRASIPETLMRLSFDSLERLPPIRGLLGEGLEPIEEPPLELRAPEAPMEPIRIAPRECDSPIAAIDVSVSKIGETREGIVVALRGVAVWRAGASYRYIRYGPLPFHIAEGGSIAGLMEPEGDDCPALQSGLIQIATRLRNLMERWLQESICASFRDSIILFDGSLTAGTPDNPAGALGRILRKARDNGNSVLAFSKATKLAYDGRSVLELAKGAEPPYVIDIDELISKCFPSHPIKLLGRVFISRLSRDGPAFRLDVDRGIGLEGALEAISKLLGSDIASAGYPECLKLAHILSSFTSNEVVGIQRFLSGFKGIQLIQRPNLRRILFGPFGGWSGAA